MPSLIPRNGNDIVYTPHNLATKCVKACLLKKNNTVLEPACGNGVFLKEIKKYTNNIDWCEIEKNRNFFNYKKRVNWIITNPPWSKYREFMFHSMKIADKIGMLITFNHAITKARIRDLQEHGFWFTNVYFVDTPKEFPQSGFQLAFILFEKTSNLITKYHKL